MYSPLPVLLELVLRRLRMQQATRERESTKNKEGESTQHTPREKRKERAMRERRARDLARENHSSCKIRLWAGGLFSLTLVLWFFHTGTACFVVFSAIKAQSMEAHVMEQRQSGRRRQHAHAPQKKKKENKLYIEQKSNPALIPTRPYIHGHSPKTTFTKATSM